MKKLKIGLLILCLFGISIFALSACGGRHTVSFDTGAGGSSVESQRVADGNLADRPADPQREGFNFSHWSLTDGGEAFIFGATPIIGDITLIAVWNANEHRVGFNARGGSPTPSPAFQMVAHNGLVTRPTADPERTDFTFLHWSSSLDGPAFDFENTRVTAPSTIYAVWHRLDVFYFVFDADASDEQVVVTFDNQPASVGRAVVLSIVIDAGFRAGDDFELLVGGDNIDVDGVIWGDGGNQNAGWIAVAMRGGAETNRVVVVSGIIQGNVSDPRYIEVDISDVPDGLFMSMAETLLVIVPTEQGGRHLNFVSDNFAAGFMAAPGENTISVRDDALGELFGIAQLGPIAAIDVQYADMGMMGQLIIEVFVDGRLLTFEFIHLTI